MNKFASVLEREQAFDTSNDNLKNLVANIRVNNHYITKH